MSVKVLVIGAGGVIGQHMMIAKPEGVEAVFTRRTESGLYRGFDMLRNGEPYDTLNEIMPDVVVNLAGENNVDWVESHKEGARLINVDMVQALVGWCGREGKHLIHVSSQAVLNPVNTYGIQKAVAEDIVKNSDCRWSIVRPTFVLGIRPFPGIGRENPAERILSGKEEKSVDDRYFSVSFAWDVAESIWQLATDSPTSGQEISKIDGVLQVGDPATMSRFSVARHLGVYPKRVRHDSLGITQRPGNTTYSEAWHRAGLEEGFSRLEAEFGQRSLDTAPYRAKEIAAFLGIPWWSCLEKLNRGFGALHNDVSTDFRFSNPTRDDELLTWYRTTESYIWELTAYHLDKGFNYAGMSSGIAAALKSKGVKRVLCLGDGVGSLTLTMRSEGLKAYYHDLYDSRTYRFAHARFLMRDGVGAGGLQTETFKPVALPGDWQGDQKFFDAIVSLDFLEHVPNVDEWVKAIHGNLKPGGWFVAQNAFNMGSGPQGSIPMHLTVNDHYDTDWDPLLFSLGFVQEKSNWYQKPL